MNKQDIKELCEAYGFEEIVSKNPHMYSFLKDGARLNYYFKRGTLTIQKDYVFVINQKSVLNLPDFEDALLQYNNAV